MSISKGKRVKDFRNYLGLTQAQIAQKLEITQQAVQRVESNNGNFNIETLEKLSTLLNLNIDWLLTGNGKMFDKPKNTFEIKYEPLNDSDFGKRLNKIRINADMVSKEVAMLLEMKETRFSELVNGGEKPTLDEIKRICENFNVTADWLLFGKE